MDQKLNPNQQKTLNAILEVLALNIDTSPVATGVSLDYSKHSKPTLARVIVEIPNGKAFEIFLLQSGAVKSFTKGFIREDNSFMKEFFAHYYYVEGSF